MRDSVLSVGDQRTSTGGCGGHDCDGTEGGSGGPRVGISAGGPNSPAVIWHGDETPYSLSASCTPQAPRGGTARSSADPRTAADKNCNRWVSPSFRAAPQEG